MTETGADESGREDRYDQPEETCHHSECDVPLHTVESVKVDAGSGEPFCSMDHLLAKANRQSLDEIGELTPPSDEGELTTVVDGFTCMSCRNDSSRLSYERGEWVHYPCGMPVDDEAATLADEQLSIGHGESDYTERQAKAMAGTLRPLVEDLDENSATRMEN